MSDGGNQGRTLERALDLIECVESSRAPMKPAQIAKATGLHIATTQRIAATLMRRGYLRAEDGGYTLGPIVLPLAHAFVLQDRLTKAAYPVLSDLTEGTGLTSSVYVRNGWTRILIARVEAPSPLRYQFPIGQRLGLELGGGKVLLAQMDDAELEEYLAAYAPVTTTHAKVQEAEDLRADIERIRREGSYVSRSERYPGALSVTAMITSSAGLPVGVVNLVTHDAQEGSVVMESRAGRLLQAGRLIGEQL